ncbi:MULTISPECIES: V-type ATP synthase subunit I [Peptoniphilus]|jgi:V-type sodium ATPase, I subunit|uniref:V-type ATP synthase subunit I n=1 Tax=Peptoniphilus TaxID=162289 RepID=UPI0023562CDE|nr:V-type ATP synthase subunit I [Peptoniphilus rhinitidis]MDU5595178.1 V-type ATP synthase subunit I [Peptoniphilus rhinitidis]
MAIVNMKEFKLFIFDDSREKLIDRFQKFNYVHIVESDFDKDEYIEDDFARPKSLDDLIEIDDKIKRSKEDIDLLLKFKEKESAIKSLKDGVENITLEELADRALRFPFEKIDKEIRSLVNQKDKNNSKVQNIDSKIFELKPWRGLSSSLEGTSSMDSVNVYTGTVAANYADKFEREFLENELIYIERVSQDKNFRYYLIIVEKSVDNEVKDIFSSYGFTPINIKADKKVEDKINSYEKDKELLFEENKDIEENLKKYLKYLDDLKYSYEFYRNEKVKIMSQRKFLKTTKVDMIEGYVPNEKLSNFEKEVKKVCGDNYYLSAYDANRDSNEVPILLENNSFVKPFELMTEMYAMPRYNEIDPTPFFAPFYFIFAGIMVGDFGYGLLVFLGTLFALKNFNLTDKKRRFLKFFNYLSISTIIFGLVFGSFFGGIIELPSLIDPAEDSTLLVILSLILGGIHIFFALGIKAYMDIRDGKPKDALYDVGFWYMALIGIIGLLLQIKLENLAPYKNVFLVVMILGMIGIVATGGREEKTTGEKIGWGIYSLYGISSYLGDFVSYLRMMALVLSGSFLGLAINMIAGMLFESNILGKIFAIVVFVVFQLFNAFLCYLSAYVHTARLTYVEMFNKFYEGGGIPFKKMIENSDYFNID